MNVVVLTYDEKFIQFLDPELLTLTTTDEIDGIRTISVEYTMSNQEEAQQLFRLGNKIWINTTDNHGELYVINTQVKRDYFKENNVTFDAEDVITELNYAPFFNQNDLTAANGFTLGTNNGEMTVKVDYNALKYWFGEYYNIGVVQDCLNTRIQKISPMGTMNKMELLRYIEEETSNRFITRYEKDIDTNIIHRYLDYLNPNSNDSNWETWFHFNPNTAETSMTDELFEPSDEENEIIPYNNKPAHSPANLLVKLTYDDETLAELDATDLGLDDDSNRIDLKLKYDKPNLVITTYNKTYGDDPSTIFYGDDIIDETLFASTTSTATVSDITIPNGTLFSVTDTENEEVLYYHEIRPVLGDVHTEVLDLGYNTENIEYTINEEDTFIAAAPNFTSDEGSNGFGRTDLQKVINNWVNLEVTKGQIVPMIVQRETVKADLTTKAKMNTFITNNNTSDSSGNITKYYQRPIKPTDSIDDGTASNSTFEFNVGTAYWAAPYSKHAGEMHIEIDEDTGAEYAHIITRADTTNPYGATYRPKLGQVSTTEEDKYAIYNALAMSLKDHKDPSIEVNVDVANYMKGEYNNYNLYDKVHVKIPGFEHLITAIVSKTFKNMHDIGENSIELTNFTVNTKVATKETVIYGDNVSFKYPKTSNLTVTLADITSENDVNLANKLVTFSLYRVDDNGSTTFRKAYNKKTNTNGVAKLPLGLTPGNFLIEVNFGGDVEYTSSNASFEVNVSGEIVKPKTTTPKTTPKTSTKYTTKKRYWTKCGISPDKKEIVSIAQPSASNSDMKKYGVNYNTTYKTVFKNKCPYCGKAALRYDDGKKNGCITNHGHKGNKKEVPEGEITCHHCDSDFDGVTGLEKSNRHTGRLTMVKKPVKSNKTEKAKLISGKLLYDTVKVKVKQKNISKKASQTTLKTINKKVKEKGQKLAKGKSDYQALRAIANFMAHIRYQKYANHKKNAKSVLTSRKGNCVDQARLFAELCDAAGILDTYDLYYVHVCCNHTSWPGVGHVFTKVCKKNTSKGVYVDPTCSSPYNHYTHGWGSPPGTTKKYPQEPL